MEDGTFDKRALCISQEAHSCDAAEVYSYLAGAIAANNDPDAWIWHRSFDATS